MHLPSADGNSGFIQQVFFCKFMKSRKDTRKSWYTRISNFGSLVPAARRAAVWQRELTQTEEGLIRLMTTMCSCHHACCSVGVAIGASGLCLKNSASLEDASTVERESGCMLHHTHTHLHTTEMFFLFVFPIRENTTTAILLRAVNRCVFLLLKDLL